MRLISIRILVRRIVRNNAKSEFPGKIRAADRIHIFSTFSRSKACRQLYMVIGIQIVVNEVYLYECLGEPDFYLHSDSSAGELFHIITPSGVENRNSIPRPFWYSGRPLPYHHATLVSV